jgi:hypothetical protein
MFLEATAAHPGADIAGIASFAGRSVSTAKKAMPALEELNLISRNANGTYNCLVTEVRRGMDDSAARRIFRHALLQFRPFELFIEGINLGESVPEAARKTRLLLRLETSEEANFDILVRWARELGILNVDGGVVELAAEIRVQPGEELAIISTGDLLSEAKVRLYISGKLSRDVFNSLDEVDRHLLAEAALEYRTNPRTSVEHSGQAIEDLLREIAENKGLSIEAKRCNGAGQLASLLCSKSILHGHHQHFIDGLGAARNATAHRKDKKTLIPWDITDTGAFWAFLGALAVIRSIFFYVHEGKQTL